MTQGLTPVDVQRQRGHAETLGNHLTVASRFTGGNNARGNGFLMKAVGGIIGLIATFEKVLRHGATVQEISLLAGEKSKC